MPSMPTSATLPVITPPHRALHHTRFSQWFPLYRRHSPKATVIDLLSLQPDFVDWLEEDGLVLPSNSDYEQTEQSGGNEDPDSGSESDEDAEEPRNFDVLNARIRQVLSSYEGAVFPKLDWSAPLDAAWIVPGSTLRCTTPSDVYLLLKSSDFVSKDISQLRELEAMNRPDRDGSLASLADPTPPIRPSLVLKKFFAMPTSHEFRCFVRAGQLVCISQRDTSTFYDHLQDTTFQLQVRRLLHAFHSKVLSPAQASDTGSASSLRTPFPIDDFVWDAYISRDMQRVFLVDVNPFLERTDGLLWTWDEIEELAERRTRGDDDDDDDGSQTDSGDETIMRIFTDGREPVLIRPNGQTAHTDAAPRSPRARLPRLRTISSRAQTMQSFPTYARNMIPSDVVGAAEGNNIADFAREWNRKIAQTITDDVDGDDGEEEVRNMPGR